MLVVVHQLHHTRMFYSTLLEVRLFKIYDINSAVILRNQEKIIKSRLIFFVKFFSVLRHVTK